MVRPCRIGMGGAWWHTATMQISMNHSFERRVGLWSAGLQGWELFCNQRYGDWPMNVEGLAADPWKDPEWYLLSYGKRRWRPPVPLAGNPPVL